MATPKHAAARTCSRRIDDAWQLGLDGCSATYLDEAEDTSVGRTDHSADRTNRPPVGG